MYYHVHDTFPKGTHPGFRLARIPFMVVFFAVNGEGGLQGMKYLMITLKKYVMAKKKCDFMKEGVFKIQ
ncbi:MAG: hypothetical protein RDV48_04890 [Candidatus Eremiobacteraeota bacterium]|nr:hypothetical protein [Candidatus Eremiobacteraeota bacterium]